MSELTAYNDFFKAVIDTINSAKYNAYKSLNKYHIGQNFELGKLIVKNQEKNNWGKSIVDTLSRDINKTVDGAKGYSCGSGDVLFGCCTKPRSALKIIL